MCASHIRPTFDEVEALARTHEHFDFEMKNSSYVVLEHRFNLDRKDKCGKSKPIKGETALRDRCRRMLGKECGAFANSGGGRLVIGFTDDGKLDDVPIPEFFNNSKKRTDEWLADIIRTSLEPPLQDFECYFVENDKDMRLIVVDVQQSSGAPHQSKDEKLYYTRQEKSAEPAQHWLIEAIRNKKVHPRVVATLDSFRTIYFGKGETTSATLTLKIIFENNSRAIAQHWAFAIESPFPGLCKIEAGDNLKTIYDARLVKGARSLYQATAPLYPHQQVSFVCEVSVCASVRTEREDGLVRFAGFSWSRLDRVGQEWRRGELKSEDGEFVLKVTTWADNADETTFDLFIGRDGLRESARSSLMTWLVIDD